VDQRAPTVQQQRLFEAVLHLRYQAQQASHGWPTPEDPAYPLPPLPVVDKGYPDPAAEWADPDLREPNARPEDQIPQDTEAYDLPDPVSPSLDGENIHPIFAAGQG